MKKLNILSISLSLAVLLVATGCKTTEKNYQQAYDVAIKKKQADKEKEEEIPGIPKGVLRQSEGPQKRTIDGIEVYVENRRLKRFDNEALLRGKYCVVIGAYKMKTNCQAQVNDLVAKGYPAFMATDPKGMYFVVAGEYPNMEEAAKASQTYAEKERPSNYVGFESGPVIFESY